DVRWPARLEILSKDGRRIVMDGAHNPYSMKRLVQAVRQYFTFDNLILIFGALGGHSARGMIAELADLSPTVIVTRSRHPRSSPSASLAEIVSGHGLRVAFSADNVGEAARKALEIAEERDLILATGSLSVVAEVKEEIEGIIPEVYPNLKPPPNVGAQRVI
ncbi:MAG: glutamate ligase domain-containing protein, partial [Ardenticatenaceae bacterium]